MTSLGRKVEVLLKEISDKYQYIHIGDLPSVRSKLAILEADGVDKTHIVTDFDMTLTKYWKNGERSMSSHGVVENSSVLPPSVRDGMRKLYAKYYPIEIDKHIPFPEKVQAMVEWWTHAHDLLINDAHLLRSTIAEMVLENPVSFRDGIGAFLKMTQEITMPVLVFSAGLADLIDEILTSSGYSPPNLTIVSNEMSFDEGGKLIGFKDPLIHTFNKNEATASDLHTSKIAGRDHVILMGDSIGDLQMSYNLKYKVQLSIGFLNHDQENLLEKYESAFDIVVLKDSSLEWITRLLDALAKPAVA